MTPITFIVLAAARGNPVTSFSDLWAMFVVYAPFAYLAVVVCGIPAFVLFRFLHFENVVAYVFCGAAIGTAMALFVSKFVVIWNVASSDYIWCAIAGGVSALVFWLIIHGFRMLDGPRVSAPGET